MIKLIFAIIISLTLIVGGICLEIVIENTFTDLSQKVSDTLNLSKDATYNIEDIEEIINWWNKKHDFLEFFVSHTYLNEMDIVLGELKGSVGAEDYPTSTALLTRLYQTSIAMSEMFSFKFGNVI